MHEKCHGQRFPIPTQAKIFRLTRYQRLHLINAILQHFIPILLIFTSVPEDSFIISNQRLQRILPIPAMQPSKM